VELAVGAIDDRSDPPDVLGAPARHEKLHLGVAEERVLVLKDLDEVGAQRGDPVRVVAIEALRDVEKTVEVVPGPTDPLD
jgi:hypothetical protein